MKKLAIILFILILYVNPLFAQDTTYQQNTGTPSDFTGSFLYYVPGDDNVYDSGLGAEAQFRFWPEKFLGLACTVGVADWEANDDLFYTPQPDNWQNLDGSALLIPAGVSILLQPALNEKLCLTLEGGIRYVIVDSSMELKPAGENFTADLDIDNGLVGLISINIEAKLSPKVGFLGGVGYQFDISEGDVEIGRVKIGENELKAFFIRTGVLVRF